MAKDSFRATLYLFQGDKQPDILTVRSFAEAVEWASQYERTRVVSEGYPPFWIKPKTTNTVVPLAVEESPGEVSTTRKKLNPSTFYDPWKTYTKHKNH